MKSHDHSYKHLFSHREMVADLLTGFVNQHWVQELDLASLEKLNASYVSDDLRERTDDVVWRVRFRNEWLYVYVLLEFQSTVDNFMAVRLLTYVGLLYQDLIKSKQLPAPQALPPVFPIVLYNGSKPWHAAENLSSLIQSTPAELQVYQPGLRYLLINESEYNGETLAPLHNLVATLFQLENSATILNITRLVGSLATWLKAPEQQSLNRAFTQWLNRVLLPAKSAGQTIETVHDLMEMQAMLAERVKDWTEEWKKEGLEAGFKEGLKEGLKEGIKEGIKEGLKEGIKEGLKEGLKEGEANLLKRQLTKRFGPLPAWALEKLDAAEPAQLETWANGIFDATSLEGFFRE